MHEKYKYNQIKCLIDYNYFNTSYQKVVIKYYRLIKIKENENSMPSLIRPAYEMKDFNKSYDIQ